MYALRPFDYKIYWVFTVIYLKHNDTRIYIGMCYGAFNPNKVITKQHTTQNNTIACQLCGYLCMEYLNVPMGFIQDSSPHLVFGLLSIVQAPIALSNSSYDSKKQ